MTEENGFKIQIHHVIPILFAEVQRILTAYGSRIVDQNIDPAKRRHRLCHDAGESILLAEVGLNSHKTSTEGVNFLCGFMWYFTIHADYIAARFSQRHCHTLPKAGVTSSDDGYFTFETKSFLNHVYLNYLCH